MASVFIRIFLRYLAAALITKGLLSPDIGGAINSDPDIAMAIEVAIGAAIGLASEGWYYLAHRFGWRR